MRQQISQISIGVGSFDALAGIIGDRRYCLVTYGELYFANLAAKLAKSAGAPLIVIDDVAPNPDFALLNQQSSRFRSLKIQPDVFVALGGGSVIDTAKVLASAGGDFDRVKIFLKNRSGEKKFTNIPIVAVPTTAGTGSEVTCWATVWDNAEAKKYSLNRPALYPEHAVIDPELMLGKSRALTISSGLDALSHALESIWNVNATQVSMICAIKAATEILEVLPKLVDDLDSVELRTRMAGASLMSGIAFSKTKTALAHSISYPISLRHGVVHGVACSFTLPIILHSMADDTGPSGLALKKIFGDNLASAAGQLSELLKSLGISTFPSDYDISPGEWGTIVEEAFDGERGLNFIGTRQNFNRSAQIIGVA